MTDSNHVQTLERLLEISRSLSAPLEAEQILQSITALAAESTSSELASILEYEPESGKLRFLAMPWFHRDVLRDIRVSVDHSIAGWACRQAKPVIVPDVRSDPRHDRSVDQATDFETRSILAVPVIYRGEPIGVMEVLNKAGQAHYTGDDLSILEILASQAAVAMENKRTRSQIQHSLDELSQLDRMKNDFISIASHELRTPLGLILGHATFLREIIDAEHKQQMDIIVRNAMKLKSIIDSIADIDNFERGVASIRRRSISIRRVIEEVADSFTEEAKYGEISLRVNMAKDDLHVEGDASKIAIAISNLVKNSITFTNPGGHIQISAEEVPGFVKISVADDGIGIPASDLPHIFERFYQVESHLTRRHGGMGLGLSVAKVMIEMHGGRIWAESLEGKGSKFSFLLPLKPDQADSSGRVFVT